MAFSEAGGRRVRCMHAAMAIVASVSLTVSWTGPAVARSVSLREPSVTAAPRNFGVGLDDFYTVPNPLPPGAPGELIRTQEISRTSDQVSLRIMYHSRDVNGLDRAVTGVATYPLTAAPQGGWPVVSTAHGTTGLATQCAPSRTATGAPGWGVAGVAVMTDYIGLGPIGELHSYLSRTDEGDSVIDAVRAVRNIPEAHASANWLSIGHSQGGHGAMAAAELANSYAPELQLLGTVALAPGAMFDRVYGGIDPIVTAILTLMSLYGNASEYPDINLADYFTPQALQAAQVIRTGCLDAIQNALVPAYAAGMFVKDPRYVEPTRSLILSNDVGNVVEGVPLFLANGTLDDRVVIQRTEDLYARLCAVGQVTEFHVVEGADHASVLPATAAMVTQFLNDRIARRPAVNSCTAPADVPTTPTTPAGGATPSSNPGSSSSAASAVSSTPTFTG